MPLSFVSLELRRYFSPPGKAHTVSPSKNPNKTYSSRTLGRSACNCVTPSATNNRGRIATQTLPPMMLRWARSVRPIQRLTVRTVGIASFDLFRTSFIAHPGSLGKERRIAQSRAKQRSANPRARQLPGCAPNLLVNDYPCSTRALPRLEERTIS
jgi:hypothetical protein